MELHKAPCKTWVRVVADNMNPPASITTEIDDRIWFDHLDGMYSYCLTEQGDVVHLVAWTDVEIIEDMLGVPKPQRKIYE